MKKLLSVVLALLMLAVMLPVTAMAADGYVTVSGINGFKNRQFASFEETYNAIKPELAALCESGALAREELQRRSLMLCLPIAMKMGMLR